MIVNTYTEMVEAERDSLAVILTQAVCFILDCTDTGYGMSGPATAELLEILRGESL